MAGGVRESHTIADCMSGGGNVAFRTNVAVAMELVMAHPMAMETGSPVSYMRVQEGFIVLGYG